MFCDLEKTTATIIFPFLMDSFNSKGQILIYGEFKQVTVIIKSISEFIKMTTKAAEGPRTGTNKFFT